MNTIDIMNKIAGFDDSDAGLEQFKNKFDECTHKNSPVQNELPGMKTVYEIDEKRYNLLSRDQQNNLWNKFDVKIIPCSPSRIGHISSQDDDSSQFKGLDGENFIIYPGYVEIRPDYKKSEKLHSANSSRVVFDSSGEIVYIEPPGNSGGGLRGNIHSFSPQSRVKMIKLVNSLSTLPDYWQTLTFPDDTMEDLSLTERAKFSYECLRKFWVWFQRKYEGVWIIWRRDWENRKTGNLEGEIVPHFHLMIGREGFRIPESEFRSIAEEVGKKWVNDIIGTEQIKDALDVALGRKHSRRGGSDDKAFEFLKDSKMANAYVSKYMAKTTEREIKDLIEPWDSVGRFWGKLGDVPISEPQIVKLSVKDSLNLRNFFKKRAIKNDKKYKKKSKLNLKNLLPWQIARTNYLEECRERRKYNFFDRLGAVGISVFVLISSSELLSLIENLS